MQYFLVGIFTYVFVACKAFQQLNVMRSKYSWVMPTSIILAALEFYVITQVVVTGWGLIVLPIGLGGGLGCITSMYIHQRLVDRDHHKGSR